MDAKHVLPRAVGVALTPRSAQPTVQSLFVCHAPARTELLGFGVQSFMYGCEGTPPPEIWVTYDFDIMVLFLLRVVYTLYTVLVHRYMYVYI